MFKHATTVLIMLPLVILSFSLSSCESKTKAVDKKSAVVSKKISNEIKPESAKAADESSNTKSEQANPAQLESKLSENKNISETNNKDNILTIDSSAEKSDLEIQEAVNISNDEEKRKAAELLAIIHQEATIDDKENGYSLDSLNNPFLPLFKDQAEPEEKSNGRKRAKRPPISQIEKVDLSQLKLVATLRAKSGNKALVEDSTGKGYVIEKGTYIGINQGSVVEITNESVIVEEEIETMTGEVKIQKREIKLQKAPGE